MIHAGGGSCFFPGLNKTVAAVYFRCISEWMHVLRWIRLIQEGQNNLSKKPISTSPDYPLYEKMKRKSPKAAKLWLAGDRFYHAGLFLTMVSLPALFFVYIKTGTGIVFFWFCGALALSAGIFALGIFFKRESYKLAIKAGIDIDG
jgi:hypothetical protein